MKTNALLLSAIASVILHTLSITFILVNTPMATIIRKKTSETPNEVVFLLASPTIEPNTPIENNKTQSNSFDVKTRIPPSGADTSLGQPVYYYDSNDVHTLPAPISDWSINQLDVSKRRLAGATVSLTLWISDSGKIDRIEYINGDSFSDDLRDALESIQDTVMAPATVNGTPVPSFITIELRFGS